MMWLLLCAFVSLVDSHSYLATPQAFSTRESKSSPCGNGAASAAKITLVDPATSYTGQWRVTAGDGNGPVSYAFSAGDTVGTFVGNQIATNEPKSGTGNYETSWQSPAVGDCGPTNICIVQFKSTSNWYSCAKIQLNVATEPPTATPTPPPTQPPTLAVPEPTLPPSPVPTAAPTSICEQASGLTLCNALNGKWLLKIPGMTFAQYETAYLQSDYEKTKDNLRIYREGASARCAASLAEFHCARSFNECPLDELKMSSKVCKSRCQRAERFCDLAPLHEGAYGCDQEQFSELTEDKIGKCSEVEVPSNRVCPNICGWTGEKTFQVTDVTFQGNWAPDLKYFNEELRIGDKLEFTWVDGDSDLWKFPNLKAYTDCDFSQATKLSTDGVNTYSWTAETEGSIYLGSNIGGNCALKAESLNQAAQKLNVTVVGDPQSSPVAVDPLLGGNSAQETRMSFVVAAVLAMLALL